MDDRIGAIYALWDELADFPVGESDAALMHLLERLCAIFDAQNALWSAMVRLPPLAAGDRLHGWRPRVVRLLHTTPALLDSVRQQFDEIGSAEPDLSLAQAVSGEETFRTQLLVEALPREWFEGEHYRRHYLNIGFADSLSMRWALNDDVRIHLQLFRSAATARFVEADKAPFGLALRALKWFMRRQLLGQGLLVASTPLTPDERAVLRALLDGRPEKQIAQDLAQTSGATHSHVKSIYSKLGVNKRAAMTALWLGNLR